MPPVSLLIKPASAACDLRCKYCFYRDVASHRAQKSYGFMAEKTQEVLLRKAFDYAQGSVAFAFQGGEPTLAGLDYFKRHVRLCREMNKKKVEVINTIQTNGMLIDGEWAQFFAENNFLVGLSLDGPKSIHDQWRVGPRGEETFDTVCRAATELERHGVQFNILSVVTGTLAKNASRAMEFFEGKGFRYLQFIPCIEPFGNEKPEGYSLTPDLFGRFLVAAFKKYYDAFKKMRPFSIRAFDNYVRILAGEAPESCDMNGFCNAYFVVEADGSVFPCDFYVLDGYCMGNIVQDSLSAMAQSETAKKFIAPSLEIAPKCRACRWFFLCRGGCRRLREGPGGELTVHRFCEAYVTFFEKCYRSLREIADRYVAYVRSR